QRPRLPATGRLIRLGLGASPTRRTRTVLTLERHTTTSAPSVWRSADRGAPPPRGDVGGGACAVGAGDARPRSGGTGTTDGTPAPRVRPGGFLNARLTYGP